MSSEYVETLSSNIMYIIMIIQITGTKQNEMNKQPFILEDKFRILKILIIKINVNIASDVHVSFSL